MDRHTKHRQNQRKKHTNKQARNLEAVANSKRVTEAMHEYMQSLPLLVTTNYPNAPTVETIDAAAQAEQTLSN